MSTVSSTSAGLLAPSVLMRCSRPELAEIDVDLDAGVLGEGIEQRLDQLGFAIGVDIDLAVGGRRRGSECGKTKQRGGCGGGAKVVMMAARQRW